MKKVLVVGSRGQVGSSLREIAGSFGFEACGLDYPQVDITQINSIRQAFEETSFDLLINAAAYTAVDKAEEDETQAYAVNDTGTRNLGLVCKEQGIPCFHISTDYVFDGSAELYSEGEQTAPLSVYGHSKLAGELSLQEVCPENVILRSCWIYSEFGNNFLKTMLRLAQTRDELGVVADQFGGPTSARHVAEALLKLAQLHFSGKNIFGLYHFSGMPHTNWYDFAETIFKESLNLGLIKKKPKLNALTTEQYPTPAVRPANSKLDVSKISAVIDDVNSDWHSEIKRILRILKEEQL
jgi:dTDP-4-dehydrorhamnose reductase